MIIFDLIKFSLSKKFTVQKGCLFCPIIMFHGHLKNNNRQFDWFIQSRQGAVLSAD